jgi:hypothetical protein
MKALVFELILLLAFLQEGGEPIYNIISECNPENNCEKCWDDESMTCYSCKEGYIFGFKSSLTCYKPANIRDIKGYGRSCVECGLGNYADANENYKCKPCPFKCKTCEFVNDGPKCIDCKPAIGETDGYVLNEDCSCTFGDEKNNKGCYCNNENKFIDSSDGSQYCLECTTCDRRQKNCKVLEIPCKEHEFDPLSVNPSLIDDLEADICCQKCDETCETCVGKTQEDCIECRNHDLYEMVGNECLCVCDAAWIDNGDGSHTCTCMYGTEKTDTCPDESCDAKTRYQCRCPAGTQKGEVNADGYSECVAQ